MTPKDPNEDPLHRIAESLTNLERLYVEELRRHEEQTKEYDERARKWDKLYLRNGWVGQITWLLLALAIFALSVAINVLLRH